MFVANNRYSIYDGERFVSFDGINKITKDRSITLTFTNGQTITVSTNHRFVDNGVDIIADHVKCHDMINGHVVTSRVDNVGKIELFDIVNSDSHRYVGNQLINHNCSFIGSSNTLIDSAVIDQIKFIDPISKHGSLSYFVLPQDDHDYVVTCDVSRGHGNDYSTFTVIDITSLPYVVVATFKDNTIGPTTEFPALIVKVATYYNKAMVVVENNDLGEATALTMWNDFEYDNMLWTDRKQGISSSDVIGVKTTRKVKATGCNALKNIIDNGKIVINDFRIIEELNVFVRQKRGLYGAQDVHINDDLVANLWLFGWLTQQPYFENITDINVNQVIGEKFAQQVDQYLPIGGVSDGTDDDYPSLSADQIAILR